MLKCEIINKNKADYVKISPILICYYVKIAIFACHY